MTTRQPTPFKLAVFDVAGTTVLDNDAVVECLTKVLEDHIAVPRAAVLAVMGLPKPTAIRRLLAARVDLDHDALDFTVDEIHRRFRSAMIERYRTGPLAPADGAEQVFAVLRQAGVRVALDTGFSRDILEMVLSRLGWHDQRHIDFSIASDEVARGRPYPDLIHRAIALAQVTDAAQVVKIGDTPSDIEEGLAAGCGLVVGVAYGTHTRQELSGSGAVVIDRLPELLTLIGLEA